ncbi:hypothetical protein HYY75_05760 [bacterium]|nr:hypothetical protein [bacterium]
MNNKVADGIYITFDLDTHSIKTAVVELKDGINRLLSVEEELFKPSADFPNEVEFREHQVQTLKSLLQRLPLQTCLMKIALFENRELQSKIIELPREIRPEKVEEILGWEAKKLLSPNFRTEQFVFGYKRLVPTALVFIVSVIPRGILERENDLFKAAGIQLDAFYPEVFTTISIKEKLSDLKVPALSIINVGLSDTHIQIFSSGELKFFRNIPSGLGELGDRPEGTDWESYMQKIRFSFDYFRAVTKLGQIDDILFMGTGAFREGFLAYAIDYFFPSRAAPLDFSLFMDISPAASHLGNDPTRLLPFLPGVGSFFTHTDPISPKTNLFGRLQEQKNSERWEQLSLKIPYWAGAFNFALAVVIILFWRGLLVTELGEAANDLRVSLRELEADKASIANLESQKRKDFGFSRGELTILQPLLKDHFPGWEVLLKLIKSQPERLTFHSIRIQEQAELTGDETDLELDSEQNPESNTEGGGKGSAENQLEEPDSQKSPAEKEIEDKNLDFSGDKPIESLLGKFLVVQGNCSSKEVFSEFAEKLLKSNLIRRFVLLKSKRKSETEITFLLKGEMP